MRAAGYQLLPEMSPEAFAALKADIAERGVMTPIDVDEDGNILDGHHRFRAWTELQKNEPPPTIVRAGLGETEKRAFARKANVLRRHLTREQVRQLIAEQLRETPEWSDRRIGKDLGVDGKTVAASRARLQASAEIPQSAKTVGVDGRARGKAQKLPPEVEALALLAEGLGMGQRIVTPNEVKAALFDAGFSGGSVTVFQAPALSEDEIEAERVMTTRLMSDFGFTPDSAQDATDWMSRTGWTIESWCGAEGAQWRKRSGFSFNRRGKRA